MLSALGFDTKGSSRNPRNNSKYVMEVPRGFSVHVFKSPSPPAGYPQNGSTKAEYAQNRPQPTLPWKTPSNAYPPRPDPARKPSLGWNQTTDYERAVELERSKSRKQYAIYPGTVPDMYIYEPSVASTTDLPGSPSSSSSSSSSDSDTADTFAVEVSSTRASSSTETLEATAFAITNKDALTKGPSPYGQIPHTAPARPGPVIPPGIIIPSTTSARYPPSTGVSGSDDGTVVDQFDHQRANRGPNGASTALTPVRRNSDDRTLKGAQPPRLESSTSRRGSQSSVSRSTSPTTAPYGAEVDPSLRLPPGLQYAAPPPASMPQGPHALTHRATISLPASQRPTLVPEAAVSRALSAPEVPTLASTHAKRSVRWTEELVCPSPIPAGQRRKGWYNRRGDQLWTNDGRYKSPEPGQEYPPDLTNYPEPNAGWMNEDGTRIDMQHRLIPKPPLRSALKRPKPTQPEQIFISTPSAP
ncbi:hypothetical protein EIP86_008560 [Pleurotus ostreatoroseus]|nr:hypothetical protein EIP86_008560 [Pleurotus ostreatoroseus]